jgi:hypothetical protein
VRCAPGGTKEYQAAPLWFSVRDARMSIVSASVGLAIRLPRKLVDSSSLKFFTFVTLSISQSKYMTS